LMREPPLIVCATLEKNGLVLLVKHSDEAKKDYGHWLLPAGSVEPGEAPEEALRRELREELGVEAAVQEKLTEHADPYTGDSLINFLCAMEVDGIKMGDELSAFKWFDIDEVARNKNIHPGLRRFLLDFLIGCSSNGREGLP
jgi:8-oxo-dGTP diphosphatase